MCAKSYIALLTNPSDLRNTHLISLLIPFSSVGFSVNFFDVSNGQAPDEWEDRCAGVAWSIPLCVVWTPSFKFSIPRSDLSKGFWKCDAPKLQLSFTLVTSSIISAGTFERFDYAVETLFFNGRINVLCNRHSAGWMNKKKQKQLNNGCKIQTWFCGPLLQPLF